MQSFADRRPERVVWEDTYWEWAVLRPENGTFDTENYHDGYARQKWFYQAQIESPDVPSLTRSRFAVLARYP